MLGLLSDPQPFHPRSLLYVIQASEAFSQVDLILVLTEPFARVLASLFPEHSKRARSDQLPQPLEPALPGTREGKGIPLP